MKPIPLLFSLLCLSLSAQEKSVPPPFEISSQAPMVEVEADDKVNAEGDGDEGATDPFDPDSFDGSTPALVQLQVEYIEMPHEKLTDLLFTRNMTKSDATELRKDIQKLVKAGDAKVLETQIVTGRSGEKCITEAIHEQIYPTAIQAPTIPNSVAIPEKAALNQDNIKAIAALVSGPTPTSFETRNVGSTLETECTIGADPKIIDIRFAPELTWHTGDTTWQERKDPLGNVSKVAMPDFYTARLTTALTATSGSYVLAGVVSPKGNDGATDLTRKVMIFVKADVLPVR